MKFRISLLILIATFATACSDPAVRTQPAASPAPTVEPQKKSETTTAFDGERALNHVKVQVEFGPRPAGSPALEKTRQYLVKELGSYGLKPSLDEFTERTPLGPVKFKNVVAELPGDTSDIIILASHYDTKPFKELAFVGANDGGSSTGALLELARVMASQKRKSRFTYQFVFFDGEEAFCREWSECLKGKDNTYGSRHMVERLKKENRLKQIKAMILLDMIGDRDLTLARCEESSAWLVQTIWETGRELGHTRQFLNRTQSMVDDHQPFLEAGIPAVDIIDFEYPDDDNSYWHTKDDTLDKVSAESLKIVGDVILLSLPRIELKIR
ncbi:MAG: M28 family peptidase [Blastocatellia bacterium]